MHRVLVLMMISCSGLGVLLAQQRLDSAQMHERLIAIVPIVGAGTFADPKRPLLASFGTDKDDLLSYSWQPSDDGKLAIVEFVARDYSSLAKIVTDKRVVKAFEKGKHKPEDIELEIKKVKKEFTVDAFLRGGARR